MTDTDDLIERLRECATYNLDASDSRWIDELTNRAADALAEARTRTLTDDQIRQTIGAASSYESRWRDAMVPPDFPSRWHELGREAADG